MLRTTRLALRVLAAKHGVKIGSVRPETYFDIGHEYGTRVDLWVFKDGKVDILRNQSAGGIHSDYWPEVASYYRGRYDPSKKRLSVVPPYRFKHRDIPSGLMAELENKFPEAELKFFNT